MKQYIKIRNKGLILKEDLMLLGASTKTDDDTTIGKFGSGWKFALAWFARNLCLPIIYSGKDRLTLETDVVNHRDTVFEEIIIDGEKSRITSDFGKQDGWKGWMAVREVYSNALDAGECTFDIIYETAEVKDRDTLEGYTTIYIPLKGELENLMLNFTKYFAHNRTPIFTCEYGSIFQKEEESAMNIYYRNIRCINEHHYDDGFKGFFDYSLNKVNIKENRLIEYPSEANSNIKNLLSVSPINVIKLLIPTLHLDFYPYTPSTKFIEALKELKKEGLNFTSVNVVKIGGLALVGNEDKIVLPNKYFNILVDLGLEVDPFLQFRDKSFTFMHGNFEEEEQAIQYYLDGIKMPFKVKLGVLTSYYVRADDSYIYVDYKSVKACCNTIQGMAIYIARNLDSYALQTYFEKIIL